MFEAYEQHMELPSEGYYFMQIVWKLTPRYKSSH